MASRGDYLWNDHFRAKSGAGRAWRAWRLRTTPHPAAYDANGGADSNDDHANEPTRVNDTRSTKKPSHLCPPSHIPTLDSVASAQTPRTHTTAKHHAMIARREASGAPSPRRSLPAVFLCPRHVFQLLLSAFCPAFPGFRTAYMHETALFSVPAPARRFRTDRISDASRHHACTPSSKRKETVEAVCQGGQCCFVVPCEF